MMVATASCLSCTVALILINPQGPPKAQNLLTSCAWDRLRRSNVDLGCALGSALGAQLLVQKGADRAVEVA